LIKGKTKGGWIGVVEGAPIKLEGYNLPHSERYRTLLRKVKGIKILGGRVKRCG